MNVKKGFILVSLMVGISSHIYASKPGFVPYSAQELATMQVELSVQNHEQKASTDYAINVIGKVIYDSRKQAQHNGVSFSAHNRFEKGELVILEDYKDGYIYGLVVQKGPDNTYIVQIDTEGKEFKLGRKADQLGKIGIKK